MRKLILFLLIAQFPIMQYGQIIADHTVVDKFDDIPQYYIDLVKKMWLTVPGESHSEGYRAGLQLLEALNPAYDVNITESGTPEAYTTSHLRASRATWGDYSNASGWIYSYGEEDWWTNATAISRTKAGITYCNTNSLTISAIGFGWCWDASGGGPSSVVDPVYGVHWYGWAEGSGHYFWGLDAEDISVTGHTICLDTYLNATQEYIDYCATNGYSTKVFFTTGPVDNWEGSIPDEAMYQQHLKWERIRDYVTANPTRILFDYADILCYDNDGTPNTDIWNGHTFPTITTTNLSPIVPSYHISQAGAIRLAKAMWWMLARIAGWDGGTTVINDQETETSSSVNIETTYYEVRIKIDDNLLPVTIRLYNLQGSLISEQEAVGNICTFNISHLPAGIYFVVLTNSKITKTYKIVIT